MIRKKELLRYNDLQYELSWLKEQYRILRGKREGSAISTEGSAGGSRDPDKIGTLIGSMTDIQKKIHRIERSIGRIESSIRKVPDILARRAIVLRYVKGQPWNSIAVQLHTHRNTLYSRVKKYLEE